MTWSDYVALNDAVVETVFPTLEVPEPVYLDFEDEVLDALSARTGVPAADVEAHVARTVASTLYRGGPASIFERHEDHMRRWVRRGRVEPPPFLGVLASFCIAAEQMAASDGMSSANFFGRLRGVLGWDHDDHRLDQAYRRVAERFWGELNRWLVDLDGARGLPTAYALNHRYVGLTMSQALVRSADRESLKAFFRQYGFSPGAEVPPSELAMVLDSWIAQTPCPVSTSLQRLWSRGQAKDRIAQSAAVALAAWDGSHRGKDRAGDGAVPHQGRGQLSLVLEVGGFPRRRFAVQALLHLPEPRTPRDATILTADPPQLVELVPDLPGSLGLGRGSTLHAGDVLEGLLQVKDSLTGQQVERRPRRLVVFREDDLSRRWIETPQVMLGDSVRVLVHEGLLERTSQVLEAVARPGWEQVEPYPGQPEGWALLVGVEVLSHPGDLVRSDGMDDLLPLVPLTTSQLKVAGGFALPGQVRGKWHTWSPPEVRAISDAPGGFTVRLLDLGVSEDDLDRDAVLLEEWHDEGAGVVVRSLAGLELTDGDYRVEMVASGGTTPLTGTIVRLRSADTPDRRQWSLVSDVSYGAGIGVLGVEADDSLAVKGHVVSASLEPRHTLPAAGAAALPGQPPWETDRRSEVREVRSIVRLTTPDPESCLYTGRHREHIDTVETDGRGRPLVAWSHGRCRTCGLVRRYPTRLRRSSFGGRPGDERATPTARRDLSAVVATTPDQVRDWSTAFDALLHTGGGSWTQLERIAFQIEPTALFLDQFARTLEVLGHIDVRRDPTTLEPSHWEVSPTALVETESGLLFGGYWPAGLYGQVGTVLEDAGHSLSIDEPGDGLASYYADCTAPEAARLMAGSESAVPVVEQGWRQLAEVLPHLEVVGTALPRRSDSLVGEVTWFQPRDNTWVKVDGLDAPGAFRIRRFSTTDVFRTPQDVEARQVALCTVQVGKHLAALAAGRPLMSYDPSERRLTVPLGADLPGLYGRAAVAASGRPPVAERQQRLLHYDDVPSDLAHHLHDLFRRRGART